MLFRSDRATGDSVDESDEHAGLLSTIREEVVCPFHARLNGEEVDCVRFEWPKNGYGLNAVCKGNLDDLVASQVGTDWGVLTSPADHVCFIRLLSVHTQSVLIAEDSHRLEGEFMGGSEDPNGDLASVGDEDLLELHDRGVGPQSLMDRVLEVVRFAILVIAFSIVGSHG